MQNALGKYLRAIRGSLSLRDFAAKCHISHTHLDSIEKGEDPRTKKPVSISTDTLRLIADGIGEDYLLLACLADGIDPLRVTNINSSRYRMICGNHEDMDLHLFGKQNYSISTDFATSISDDEESLLNLYRELNQEGKEKLYGYADDLVSSGKYIKTDTDRMVQGEK